MVQIQHQMNILREKAQEGKLNAKDLFEGTVSISNIGIYLVKQEISVELTLALLSWLLRFLQSELAKFRLSQDIFQLNMKMAKLLKNQLPEKQYSFYKLQVSVTYGGDHRVVNGATAARFLKKWKDYLENPSSIFLNLK